MPLPADGAAIGPRTQPCQEPLHPPRYRAVVTIAPRSYAWIKGTRLTIVLVLALVEGFHLGDLYPLALLALGVALFVAVGALSHQHERAFSAAVFYVALGAIGACALSLLDVPALDPVRDHLLVERLSEFALMFAVFAAGLTVEREVRRRSVVSISILLLIVMPLSILLIAMFGQTMMGLSLGAAVLLGAVLAPTDPVLAGDLGLGPPGAQTARGTAIVTAYGGGYQRWACIPLCRHRSLHCHNRGHLLGGGVAMG